VSKYVGIIAPEKVGRAGDLLRRGAEVRQMMAVVGEEGTSIDDFTVMLKAEFFDTCYLQQNAFDKVDAATPAERQRFVFDKILEVADLAFEFADKEQARRTMVAAQDLFRNWNYAEWQGEEFKKILGRIDRFVAGRGRPQE
jgi:V/A-type H+-transporting ATPase subunit A